MYIGHRREDGKTQPLREHLNGVGELAAGFAEEFGAREHGRRAGRLHDIGKYTARGQARQADPEHQKKVDHSTAGAKVSMGLRDPFAAAAIAGHHSGLMNMGTQKSAAPSDGTFCGRLKVKIDEDYGAYRGEIEVKQGELWPKWAVESPYAMNFYTRMLFSCLVDADFLDTEAFMQDEPVPRGGGEGMDVLLTRLRAHVDRWFPPKREIDGKRCEILTRCLRGGERARGLYTLTVPTGGGKTVSSLAFALSHAAAHGMKRVIYVVPYTSIIEQNAEVFAGILGAENVLEHHSGVEYEENDDDPSADLRRKRLATENWDMPVVVTTAVQFFESLYASRTSRCRKLHNMANAVIVFDEAQMMPLPYLRPCVAAIAQLVTHYGATAVLCTATQPALTNLFHEIAPGLRIEEIVEDPASLYAFFRRVSFAREGARTDEALARALSAQEQVLCIVNSRKRAQAVFDALPAEGRSHLSTLMTPEHRRRVLEDIRGKLKRGDICRVVSTSLIEAGVDVDFPMVWREEAGLDSILQAAGRCNREGRRDARESVVHVFEGEGGVPPMFRQQVGAARIALEQGEETDSPETIRLYFEALLSLKGEAIDQKRIMEDCRDMAFRDAAEKFRLIDTETETIYIPNGNNGMLLDSLRTGTYQRKTIRLLGRDSVNVYSQQMRALLSAGKLEITPDGFAILNDPDGYDPAKGLTIRDDPGRGLFV